MFERFTQSARAVVRAAVGESERRGDGHVGTEHLLLGVALAPSAVVRQAVGHQLLIGDLRAGLTTLDGCIASGRCLPRGGHAGRYHVTRPPWETPVCCSRRAPRRC